MPTPITYGEVAGVAVGMTFPNRAALRAAGLHRALQAGIDFTTEPSPCSRRR